MVFLAAVILLALYFPYSKRKVAESLRETLPSTLTVNHFRAIYLPHPGCIVEGLTFRSNSSVPDSPPLITVQKLTVLGSYADLVLRPHHIARMVLEGLRVQDPTARPRAVWRQLVERENHHWRGDREWSGARNRSI